MASLEDGEQVGLAVQAALGVSNLEEMRYIPADRYINIQQEFQVGVSTAGLRATGVIDGYFMPAGQMEILEAGGNSDVPIIAHFNAQEGFGGVLTRATTAEEYEDIARKMWGDAADEFLALFPVESDDDVWSQAYLASTTMGLEARAIQCAELQNEYNESPAYISTFARKHPYTPGVKIADQDTDTTGAYHTSDIPYWFGTQDKFNLFRQTRNWAESDRALSEQMTRMLMNLASTGSPSTDQFDWPAWSPDNQVKAVFGDEAMVVPLNLEAHEFFATHEAAQVELPPAPPPVGPRD